MAEYKPSKNSLLLRKGSLGPFKTKDSNTLYEQTLENSALKIQHKPKSSAHNKILTNLEKQINETLDSYKNEHEKHKNTIREIRKSIHAENSEAFYDNLLNESSNKKSPNIKHNRLKSQSNIKSTKLNYLPKTEDRLYNLQQENNRLLQKLNKAKSKLKLKNEEIKLVKSQYLEKCKNEVEVKKNIELENMQIFKEKLNYEITKITNSLNQQIIIKTSENDAIILENKKLKLEKEKNEKIKNLLIEILENGKNEYDYLKNMHSENMTNLELAEETNRLLGYSLKEKKDLEQKYEKLLELHNTLVSKNGKYSEDYLYKIVDENEILKKEIDELRLKKLYFTIKFYQ